MHGAERMQSQNKLGHHLRADNLYHLHGRMKFCSCRSAAALCSNVWTAAVGSAGAHVHLLHHHQLQGESLGAVLGSAGLSWPQAMWRAPAGKQSRSKPSPMAPAAHSHRVGRCSMWCSHLFSNWCRAVCHVTFCLRVGLLFYQAAAGRRQVQVGPVSVSLLGHSLAVLSMEALLHGRNKTWRAQLQQPPASSRHKVLEPCNLTQI